MSKNKKVRDNSVVAELDDAVKAPKIKFTIYLSPETMKTIEDLFKNDNCASKTEYIEKAVRFYNGYLLQNKPELVEYLAPQITSITEGIIRGSEMRLARDIFKIAVELGIQSHIVAATNEIDFPTLHKLRAMVIDEVKRSNGVISFEKAARYQKEE